MFFCRISRSKFTRPASVHPGIFEYSCYCLYVLSSPPDSVTISALLFWNAIMEFKRIFRFLSSNVIRLSHACTLHSKTMWRLYYSDLSVVFFYDSLLIYSHEVRLQQGRNAKLKILRFCRRDSN